MNCAILCYGLFIFFILFLLVLVCFAYFWFCSSKAMTTTATIRWHVDGFSETHVWQTIKFSFCCFNMHMHTLNTLFCIFIVWFLFFFFHYKGSMDCQLNVNNCINQQSNFGHFHPFTKFYVAHESLQSMSTRSVDHINIQACALNHQTHRIKSFYPNVLFFGIEYFE